MTRYLKTALLAAAALLASCIHNDIPYPVVELRIASVEGQGFSVSENNVTSRTVTLSLDEATDIRNEIIMISRVQSMLRVIVCRF